MARLFLLVRPLFFGVGAAPGPAHRARAELAPSFLAWWGVFGTDAGQFSSPHGISSDGGEYLYVVDTYNDRVQVHRRDGGFVRSIGGRGSGQGQFYVPIAAVADTAGNLYVADTFNDRIQKLT
ncbi:MAG: hypothetical protein AB7K36_27440, partial [Chloroflexota bacterium]